MPAPSVVVTKEEIRLLQGKLVKAVQPERRFSDRLIRAVQDELELRRSMLGDGTGVRSVTLVVKVNQTTKEPRAVIATVELERTLG